MTLILVTKIIKGPGAKMGKRLNIHVSKESS